MDMQQPAPGLVDLNRVMTVQLTVRDWDVVLTALNEVLMPQRLTRPVTDNLAQQLRSQQSATLTGAERTQGSFDTAVGGAIPDGI